MRSGIKWTRTTLAVILLGGTLSAQDGFFNRPGRLFNNGNPSRATAPEAANDRAKPVKNYYQQLFAEQPDRPFPNTSPNPNWLSRLATQNQPAHSPTAQQPPAQGPTAQNRVNSAIHNEPALASQRNNRFRLTPAGQTTPDQTNGQTLQEFVDRRPPRDREQANNTGVNTQPTAHNPFAPIESIDPHAGHPINHPLTQVPNSEHSPNHFSISNIHARSAEMPPAAPQQQPTSLPVQPTAGDWNEHPSQNTATPRVNVSTAGPAAVSAEWEQSGEITVGREYHCLLNVENSGSSPAHNVLLEVDVPSEIQLVGTAPAATQRGNRLTWELPTIDAGAREQFDITVLPASSGDVPLSAFVRYTEATQTTLTVRAPQLALEVSGSQEVPIGETVAQEIRIANPGSGRAENVAVEITLPEGLQHAKGSTFTMPVGSLAAGQTQVVRVALFATAGGQHTIGVRATGAPNLVQEAVSQVMVTAPQLAVSATGPSLRFIGRSAKYAVTVANTGAARANNVRIEHAVPEGFRYVNAGQGGAYDPTTNTIVWYLGQLEPGKSTEFTSELMAEHLGQFEHHIAVSSEGGAREESVVATTVDGTASLVVEVLDRDDPVEVASETAYEVRVRNEGTKSATNISLECTLPPGVEAQSAQGPTNHRGNAQQLVFAPIGELAAGKTALYHVIVRGTGPGKHRFHVQITSDSLDEPLSQEEITYFYAD